MQSREYFSHLQKRPLLSPRDCDRIFHTSSVNPLTHMMNLPIFQSLMTRPDAAKILTTSIDKVLLELIQFTQGPNFTINTNAQEKLKLLEHLGKYGSRHIKYLLLLGDHQTAINIIAMTKSAILWGKALSVTQARGNRLNHADLNNFNDFYALFEEQRQIVRGAAGHKDIMHDGETPTFVTDEINALLSQEREPELVPA